MSARNGHRSKFNVNRKAKIQRRARTRALREGLSKSKPAATK
jgi:hypothetical protein